MATVTPLRLLAEAYWGQEKIHESVQYYSHLELILGHNFGSTHPDTVDIGMKLVSIYMQTGNIQNAAVLCHRYIAWLEQSITACQKEKDIILTQHASRHSDDLSASTIQALRELDEEMVEGLAALGDLHSILSSVWLRHIEQPQNSQALDPSKWAISGIIAGENRGSGEEDVEEVVEDWEVSDEEVSKEVREEDTKARQDTAKDDSSGNTGGVSEGSADKSWMVDMSRPQYPMYEHLIVASNYRESAIAILDTRNPKNYMVGNVDIRAKLAQSIQRLAHVRFQIGDTSDETVAMFERLLDIATGLLENYEKSGQEGKQRVDGEQAGRDVRQSMEGVSHEEEEEVDDYDEEVKLGGGRGGQDEGTGEDIVHAQLNKLREYQRDVAIALNNVGNVYLARGELAQAADVFRKSLALRVEIQAAPGDVALARGNLARVLMEQGDLEGAEVELTDALESVKQTLGSTHETYVRIKETYQQLQDLRVLSEEPHDNNEAEGGGSRDEF